MQRLRYITDEEKTPEISDLIAAAEVKGAPDPRIMSIMTRSPLGVLWGKYWHALLYEGLLPHRLKEMVRLYMSVAHQCGYCSTVRSTQGQTEGVTEELVRELWQFESSDKLSEQEKAALRYAKRFKAEEGAIDSDESWAELHDHFSDEEIIELGLFCADVHGVGQFARSLDVVSWEEACQINPTLAVQMRD
ncbi:MAG: carboxymuconolactone decarboxylase family protein [Anaerolineae bacterium]|nr:carboxymuconolactone decarboxylase family protein [Anaerolineae bacterium]